MSNQTLFNFTIFNSLLVFLPVTAIILWRKPSLWIYLLTAFIGFILSWWDLGVSEGAVTPLLLITFSFFIGSAHPRRALLTAILFAMWLPIIGFVAANLGITHPTPTEQITSLLAFIISFVGTYGGVLVARFTPRENGRMVI